MRFMVIVKANPDSEAGVLPTAEMLDEMGKYNNELIAAGLMLDGAGLQSSAKGVRVNFDGDKPLVIDGPFAETKELIGGYWVLQCKDLAECVSWVKKAPFREGEVEVRPFFEPEAFEGVASPEIIAQEQGWREEQARNAPRPN
jgi:hypothetical protein